MLRIPCVIIGYFIGCVQSAYIVSKLMAGIDIRQHGSGNAGTTNVRRVLGSGAGLIVFACDVLKAVAAYFLCAALFPSPAAPLAGLYAGVGVLLGHNFPVMLKFRGGKGIASSVGLMLCLDWRVALPVCAVGLVILAVFRYMSLLSLSLMLMFPIGMAIAMAKGGINWEVLALCVFASAMAFFMHRGNIQRLLKGTENKFDFRKKAKPPLKP